MSLSGAAVLAIWSTVAAADLAEFRVWHNTEHFPERLAIPGILEARRYRSSTRPTSFLTLYTLADLSVLKSDAYESVLRNPTPATLRNVRRPDAGMARAICRVAGSIGRARGGRIAVWRADGEWTEPVDDTVQRWRVVLAGVDEDAAFASAHLLVAEPPSAGDPAAALLGVVVSPRVVLIVEGWTGGEEMARACASLSADMAAGQPEIFDLEASFGMAEATP